MQHQMLMNTGHYIGNGEKLKMDNINSGNNQNEIRDNQPKRPMSHRVFAWIAIVLLVGMYTVTLISAISGSGSTSALFMMSLGSTVVIPGLLWLYIRFWKFSMNRDRKTFGVESESSRENSTGVGEGASMGSRADDKNE